MKTYKIECEHDVYIDSYTEGETENVNNYTTQGEYSATGAIEAVEKHFDFLCYDFNKDYMSIDDENYSKAYYSVLCDVENSEATEGQKTKWKADKLTLYANNMTLFVYEVSPAKIDF